MVVVSGGQKKVRLGARVGDRVAGSPSPGHAREGASPTLYMHSHVCVYGVCMCAEHGVGCARMQTLRACPDRDDAPGACIDAFTMLG